MAFNEQLAQDIRDVVVASVDGAQVDERKMFGGLAFMNEGKMFCGILGDDVMLRLGPEQAAAALTQPNVREMDFTGRPMKGFVFVSGDDVTSPSLLEKWIRKALEFVGTLPPK